MRILFFKKFCLGRWHLYLFIFVILGLCCCEWAFFSCSRQRLLLVVVDTLLIVVASLVTEHQLQEHRLQQLWHAGSVIAAHELQSMGSVVVGHGSSCSVATGILWDQELNPWPLHWQTDSHPICHQGSPSTLIYTRDFKLGKWRYWVRQVDRYRQFCQFQKK